MYLDSLHKWLLSLFLFLTVFLFLHLLQQNHFSFGALPHLAPMAATTTDTHSPAPDTKPAGGKGDHKHKHKAGYEKSDSKHFSDHHLPDISKFPDRFWELSGQGVWTPLGQTPATVQLGGGGSRGGVVTATTTAGGATSPGAESHLTWPQKQLKIKLDAIKTEKSVAAGTTNLTKPRKFSVDTTPLPKLESSSSFVFKWLHKKWLLEKRWLPATILYMQIYRQLLVLVWYYFFSSYTEICSALCLLYEAFKKRRIMLQTTRKLKD